MKPLYTNIKYVTSEKSVENLMHLLCRLGLTIPLDVHGYVHRVTGASYYVEENSEAKLYVDNSNSYHDDDDRFQF